MPNEEEISCDKKPDVENAEEPTCAVSKPTFLGAVWAEIRTIVHGNTHIESWESLIFAPMESVQLWNLGCGRSNCDTQDVATRGQTVSFFAGAPESAVGVSKEVWYCVRFGHQLLVA